MLASLIPSKIFLTSFTTAPIVKIQYYTKHANDFLVLI